MQGVVATAVGFAGGHAVSPTYRQVCNKDTGHAEVVLLEFDPRRVTYEELLRCFFEMHDPSRHSPGSQYRSAIFTFGDHQLQMARAVADARRAVGEIVRTEIGPAAEFWPADAHHQQYMEARGLVARVHKPSLARDCPASPRLPGTLGP